MSQWGETIFEGASLLSSTRFCHETFVKFQLNSTQAETA